MRIANLTAAIATLDRPGDLARCLDALLVGEVLPAEVVIVDQSANDATHSVVEQRRVSRVPIQYIRQQRRGLSASRNAAIACANYPIVAFTDDDCVPDHGWIAAIDRAFASPPSPDAVSGRVLPLGPEAPDTYVVSPRKSTTRADFRGKIAPWIVGTGGNFAVKREWFNRIGGYDERLGAGSPGKAAEDADLLYRLLRSRAHIRYEPDAIIYHKRQSIGQRLASRSSYGYGIGSFCGLWLRQSDPYIIRILGSWLCRQCWELAGLLGRRQWMQAYQRWLSLRGTVCGLAYGLRMRPMA
jgi:GT2 family glycosyltransferase